jgi:hypothetical protein
VQQWFPDVNIAAGIVCAARIVKEANFKVRLLLIFFNDR